MYQTPRSSFLNTTCFQARRKREHQSSETTLCFFTRVIANYCDRPPQQRQLPAFTGPHSRQQAPLHNLQSHHQPHAPWSIDNRAHEQYHEGQDSAPNWLSIQPHAQPLATAASIRTSTGRQARSLMPMTALDFLYLYRRGNTVGSAAACHES